MADREEVINGLIEIVNFFDIMSAIEGRCNELKQDAENAIAFLKEQEPILLENQHKPYGISTNANSPWISRCPRCCKKVEGKQTRFCKYCGQAVKWNE